LFSGGVDAQEVEAVSGACMMISARTFKEVGGFSEDYFMYAEDMDLAYKVRGAGYRNHYVPRAVVVHHGGSSSRQSTSAFAAVMMPEATWRFFRKTRGAAYALTYRMSLCVSALARLIVLRLVKLVSWGRADAAVTAAIAKWTAVARWTVNRDGIVKLYYRG
jgi:GT2 family glycosyltransferase